MAKPLPRPAIDQPLSESYRYISLTKGQFAIVDEQDFEDLSKFNWQAWWNKGTQTFYATRGSRAPEPRRTIYMHRQIMEVSSRHVHVDHKEPSQTLDNRRSNLRTCSPQQNRCNSRKYKRNTSGFRGVVKGTKGRWRAQATVANKVKNLGFFATPEEAHQAFLSYVTPLRGEFLRTD